MPRWGRTIEQGSDQRLRPEDGSEARTEYRVEAQLDHEVVTEHGEHGELS